MLIIDLIQALFVNVLRHRCDLNCFLSVFLFPAHLSPEVFAFVSHRPVRKCLVLHFKPDINLSTFQGSILEDLNITSPFSKARNE